MLQCRPDLFNWSDGTFSTGNGIFPCDLFDFGDGFALKQAYVNVIYHAADRSLHIDIYTCDRRYGKQRMVQFCNQLRRHLTATPC